MGTVLRARVAVLSLLALVLVGGAQAARPTEAAAAAPTEGPCRSHAISVDRSGALSALTVLDGRVIASYTQAPGRGLPFEVRAVTPILDETIGGFQPTGHSAHLVLTTRGDLYQVGLFWDHAEDRCSRSSVIAVHRTTWAATPDRAADVDAPWTSVRAVRHVASRWWALPVASA